MRHIGFPTQKQRQEVKCNPTAEQVTGEGLGRRSSAAQTSCPAAPPPQQLERTSLRGLCRAWPGHAQFSRVGGGSPPGAGPRRWENVHQHAASLWCGGLKSVFLGRRSTPWLRSAEVSRGSSNRQLPFGFEPTCFGPRGRRWAFGRQACSRSAASMRAKLTGGDRCRCEGQATTVKLDQNPRAPTIPGKYGRESHQKAAREARAIR